MSEIRVGFSGWTYPPWRGDFYPKGLVQKKELEFASRKVNSLEINGTFHSLQKPESFQKWYAETPDDFCFSVKAPQYITHIRRLKGIEEPLANFFASGVLALKEKLGPILWQFPPNVMLKDDRFDKFFELLPVDFKSAAKLAKNHGEKMEGRAWFEVKKNHSIRHAFEFRHPSFLNPDFQKRLKQCNCAMVFAHAGEKSPLTEQPTADFIYARMHGQGEEYKKGYPQKVIQEWASKVEFWSQSRDVYVYFSTDQKECSPFDAMSLVQALGARNKISSVPKN